MSTSPKPIETSDTLTERAAGAARYVPALHALAVATALATFPLIWMGGLVTSHHAGLSVPDWPTSFGYNMFALPWHRWLGPQARLSGVFYEHSHRLFGSVVGILAILLVVATWAWDRRRWARWLSVCVLGGVAIQGILGGLRVTWMDLDLAIVHACVAQAFFCLAAAMAVVTSRWWSRPGELAEAVEDCGRGLQESTEGGATRRALDRLFVVGMVSVALIYGQLIVGAIMRHYQAGLAIPDFPLSYGHLLPPTDAAELASVNQLRMQDPNLSTVTLFQVWIHFGHRIGAVMVSLAILYVAHDAIRRFRGVGGLRRPAGLLLVLLAIQLVLGILTVLLRKPADIASAHVAVGALVLLTSFVLVLRTGRVRAAVRQRGRVAATISQQPTPPAGERADWSAVGDSL